MKIENKEGEGESSLRKIILSMAAVGLFATGAMHTKGEENEPQTIQGAFHSTTISDSTTSSGIGIGGGDVALKNDAIVVIGVTSHESNNECGNIDASKIRTYIVREGDTLSQIADAFCVTEETIAWHNDIHRTGNITMGQEIVILPITGVSHVVKENETFDSIVEKYGGNTEEVLSFNNLESKNIEVGHSLVIPNGELDNFEIHGDGHYQRNNGKAFVRGNSGENLDAYFSNPIIGGTVTQGLHGYNAIDIGASVGTNVRAAITGRVLTSRTYGWNGGYGKYVVIEDINGIQTLYAHLSDINVQPGKYVNKGDVIGQIGNTGKVVAIGGGNGTHLHFEVRGALNPYR